MIDPFTTARLAIMKWRATIDDAKSREDLEASLGTILTTAVLEHLPPSLQLDQSANVKSWIDARDQESTVLLVRDRHTHALVGLVFLVNPFGAVDKPDIHIGYLFAEMAWGQGLASELVSGLVTAMQRNAPTRLIGGVDLGNPASARVLQKSGFVAAPALSTSETQVFVCDIQPNPSTS